LQVFPEVQAVVKELRGRSGIKKVGAEGFCWGGHYTAALLGLPPFL
jgi:dienelactone hydrolase